jgi:hypothetical protein
MCFLLLGGSTADVPLTTYVEWEERIQRLGVSYRMFIRLL